MLTTQLQAYGLVAIAFAIVLPAGEPQPETLLHEEFRNLDAWRPVTFDKIPRHTTYRVLEEDGGTVLQAESRASASGLAWKGSFDPAKYPLLSWRWKVANVLRKGDATRKDGDDYPLRVYVVFKYDPAHAGAAMRAKYALAKRLTGEYPPHSSLNYIWANRDHDRRVLSSPYTDRSKMVVLREGDAQAGRWFEEQVNIIEDYREAFGEDPPPGASIAIMSDSDNTEGSAKAWLDDVVLRTATADRD
jgi:hypothetical protein